MFLDGALGELVWPVRRFDGTRVDEYIRTLRRVIAIEHRDRHALVAGSAHANTAVRQAFKQLAVDEHDKENMPPQSTHAP
jgi:hypothetical protein